MTKQFIASILIGIIILLGAIFFLSTHTPSSTITSQKTLVATPTPFVDIVKELKKNEVTVNLTTTGFSPETVTIKTGMTVRWINETQATASVNSDDYPTNRKFPELNLGRFAKNESLLHAFKKPGTYTYHNQLTPAQKGTIIVQ